MRFSVGLLAFSALLISASVPAEAAWCARYQTGASNCGFATHAQCLAAISGMGGSCAQDSRAPAPAAEPAKRRATAPKEKKEKKKTVSRPRPAPVAAPAKPAVPLAPPGGAEAAAPTRAIPSPPAPADLVAARDLILDGQYEAGIKAMHALGFDDNPEVAAYIGLAHRRLGRIAEARAWYDRALRADPYHLVTLSVSGILRAQQGDVTGARVELAKIRHVCGGTACDEYRALESTITGTAR